MVDMKMVITNIMDKGARRVAVPVLDGLAPLSSFANVSSPRVNLILSSLTSQVLFIVSVEIMPIQRMNHPGSQRGDPLTTRVGHLIMQ